MHQLAAAFAGERSKGIASVDQKTRSSFSPVPGNSKVKQENCAKMVVIASEFANEAIS